MKIKSRYLTVRNIVISISFLVIISMLAVSIYRLVASGATEFSDEVQSFSTFSFCSSKKDEQCQNNVAKLNYIARTRGRTQKETFGFGPDSNVEIKLRNIIFEFYDDIESSVNGDFYLYLDVNRDGILRKDQDKKIALGYVTGRRILFEDLNYPIYINGKGYDQAAVLFSFLVETPQDYSFDRFALDEIHVDAINLSRDNERIGNTSAFEDLSVFRFADRITATPEEFTSQFPDFEFREDQFVLQSGIYEFKETVIIPKGYRLIIKDDVKILLDREVSFVSYSPLEIKGKKGKEVVVEGITEDTVWGTFGVIGRIGDFGDVKISYAKFSNGFEDHINGAYLSGMVSIYRADNIYVEHTSFSKGNADDGLNIKYGNIEMVHNVFINNSADAFDGDFVVGNIHNNLFRENGNDSIDHSGSDVEIFNNRIYDSGDKGVSVGEATVADVHDNLFMNCNIGVQVKDESEADISNNVIIDSRQYALDSYLKKPFFDLPSTRYYKNLFINNEKTIGGLIEESQLRNNYIKESEEDMMLFEWAARWYGK